MSEKRIPKSEWGPGPWQDEPDYLAFTHAGLKCFIVRNTWVTGALNGYVALPPEHPWWGKDYGDCTASPQCEPEPPPDFEEMAKSGWPVPSPGSRFRDRMMETRWSCEHQPQMILDVHGGVTYGGPAFWPDAENDLDWGFGFDCAHAGDVSPMMDATIRNMLYQYEDEAWARRQAHFGDVYRDLAYVTRQVEQLAAQLALVRQVGGIGPSVAESQTD